MVAAAGGITVQIDTTEALRRLLTFSAEATNFELANRKAAIQLFKWALVNYEGQGKLVGGWAPLKERTLKDKHAKGYSSKILLRTGTLRQNFLQFSTPAQAGIGNRISYSLFHQDGTERLPQRRLLPDVTQMQEIGLQVYGKHVQMAAQKAFQ